MILGSFYFIPIGANIVKKYFLYLQNTKMCKIIRNKLQLIGLFILIISEENPGLNKRFEINGFPTILFIKDKNIYNYKGNRTFESFDEFI